MEQNSEFTTGDPFRSGELNDDLLPIPDSNVSETVQRDDDVLLIRLGGIGDALRLLPAVHYLRNNGFKGTLDVAVEPPVDTIFEHAQGPDRIHSIPLDDWWNDPATLTGQLSSLRSESYDWVFDCHGILKSGVLTRLTRAHRKIGYHPENAKEANHLFMDQTISTLNPRLPRLLKYIQLIRACTPSFELTKSNIQPEFTGSWQPVREPIREAADQNPLLVHPTSSGGRYGHEKDWGIAQFQNLLDDLLNEYNHPIYITWGPGEQPEAKKLADPFDDRVRIAPETNPITNLCYLIQHAHMLITIDSSPAHFADFLSTPVTVIYGVAKTWVNAPFFTPYTMVTKQKEERTTSDIPPERVKQATKALLETIRQCEFEKV